MAIHYYTIPENIVSLGRDLYYHEHRLLHYRPWYGLLYMLFRNYASSYGLPLLIEVLDVVKPLDRTVVEKLDVDTIMSYLRKLMDYRAFMYSLDRIALTIKAMARRFRAIIERISIGDRIAVLKALEGVDMVKTGIHLSSISWATQKFGWDHISIYREQTSFLIKVSTPDEIEIYRSMLDIKGKVTPTSLKTHARKNFDNYSYLERQIIKKYREHPVLKKEKIPIADTIVFLNEYLNRMLDRSANYLRDYVPTLFTGIVKGLIEKIREYL